MNMMETYLNKLRDKAIDDNRDMAEVDAGIEKLRKDISAEINFYRALESMHTDTA